MLDPEWAAHEFRRRMVIQGTVDLLRDYARAGRLPQFKFLLDSTDPAFQTQWVTRALQEYDEWRAEDPAVPKVNSSVSMCCLVKERRMEARKKRKKGMQ